MHTCSAICISFDGALNESAIADSFDSAAGSTFLHSQFQMKVQVQIHLKLHVGAHTFSAFGIWFDERPTLFLYFAFRLTHNPAFK